MFSDRKRIARKERCEYVIDFLVDTLAAAAPPTIQPIRERGANIRMQQQTTAMRIFVETLGMHEKSTVTNGLTIFAIFPW